MGGLQKSERNELKVLKLINPFTINGCAVTVFIAISRLSNDLCASAKCTGLEEHQIFKWRKEPHLNIL